MKITKFGHCCLLIEEKGKRVLTDPGMYSTLQNDVEDLDLIVITHEHTDHYHIDSLKIIARNNPQTKIITNSTVGGLLDKEGIAYTIVEEGQTYSELGFPIEAYGTKHAMMHSSIPLSNNTGYFFADKFFYPGDAFTDPKRPIDILALPVAGPWMKVSEAIDYALLVKPTKVIPVHDGILLNPSLPYRIPSAVLPQNGIEFIVLKIGEETEL